MAVASVAVGLGAAGVGWCCSLKLCGLCPALTVRSRAALFKSANTSTARIIATHAILLQSTVRADQINQCRRSTSLLAACPKINRYVHLERTLRCGSCLLVYPFCLINYGSFLCRVISPIVAILPPVFRFPRHCVCRQIQAVGPGVRVCGRPTNINLSSSKVRSSLQA